MAIEYTHARADQTAQALLTYAKQLMKLTSLGCGQNTVLHLEYEDAPRGTYNDEVILCVERDTEHGHYWINNVKLDTLDDAVHVWAMACATVVKPIASDEKREDDFEEESEAVIPATMNEIMDAYGDSETLEDSEQETDDSDSTESDQSETDQEATIAQFLASWNPDINTLVDAPGDDEKVIYEMYDGLTLELKSSQEDSYPSDDEVPEDITDEEQNQHGAEAA